MFGLTEITGQLANQIDEPVRMAIIPTFVLPFTILGMILTSLATWVAALFGVELRAEGPKRLFEVLMKPKILILALISNAIVYAAVVGGKYLYNKPSPIWLISYKNQGNQSSKLNYSNTSFERLKLSAGTAIGGTPVLKLLWQTEVGGAIFGGLTISGDSIFFGSDNGKVYELDAASGKPVRSFFIGKPVTPSPVILDNYLFTGEGVHDTHHARLYSFDLKTGKLQASFETKGHIERSSVVAGLGADNKILIVPSGKDGIYALKSDGLEKLWQAPVGHIDSWPLVDGDRVFVGSGQEKGFEDLGTTASAIDLATGRIIWAKSLPISSWGLPFVWRDLVCFEIGDVYKATHFGQVSCYKRDTGEEDLAITTSGALIGQPVVEGDYLYVADFHGNVYKLDLVAKKIDWRIAVPTKGFNYASVVLDGHGHFILPGEEGLYVYSLINQKLITVWKPEGVAWKGAYANISIHNEVWYLADRKGLVRALKLE